jgi:hypothetical protein
MGDSGARPNFFLAGAPACGIDLMHQYLGQHPGAFAGDGMDERVFFDPELKINISRPVFNEAKYLAQFRKGAGKERVGQTSPWCMLSNIAAKGIVDWDGRAQAILMVRSPVDAAYALHGEMVSRAEEDIEDFAAALEAEEDRRAGKRIPPRCSSPDALQYTEIFTYATQVKRFFDALGRHRVKVIIYDDFVLNTGQVYRDTLQFLGLDTEFEADFRAGKSARTASRGLASLFSRRVPRKLDRPEKVSPEVRQKLLPRFDRDVQEMCELLNRDLRHWCKL